MYRHTQGVFHAQERQRFEIMKAVSQGMTKTDSHHQNLGRGKKKKKTCLRESMG